MNGFNSSTTNSISEANSITSLGVPVKIQGSGNRYLPRQRPTIPSPKYGIKNNTRKVQVLPLDRDEWQNAIIESMLDVNFKTVSCYSIHLLNSHEFCNCDKRY